MRAITVCPAGVEGVHGPIADRLVGPSANVAPLVAYLASEQAGWINGHVFDISGSGRLGLYRPMIPERVIEARRLLRRGDNRRGCPAVRADVLERAPSAAAAAAARR